MLVPVFKSLTVPLLSLSVLAVCCSAPSSKWLMYGKGCDTSAQHSLVQLSDSVTQGWYVTIRLAFQGPGWYSGQQDRAQGTFSAIQRFFPPLCTHCTCKCQDRYFTAEMQGHMEEERLPVCCQSCPANSSTICPGLPFLPTRWLMIVVPFVAISATWVVCIRLNLDLRVAAYHYDHYK